MLTTKSFVAMSHNSKLLKIKPFLSQSSSSKELKSQKMPDLSETEERYNDKTHTRGNHSKPLAGLRKLHAGIVHFNVVLFGRSQE